MNLEIILAVLVSSLASGGVVGVVAKVWLDHTLSIRLAEIEAKHKMTAHEHQVRFTRYDERVASAIEGAYALVCQYSDSVREAVRKILADGIAGANSEIEAPEAVADDFARYMQRNSIYLPEDITDMLTEVRGMLRDTYTEELRNLRQDADSGSKGSKILGAVYKNDSLRIQTEKIMLELQSLAREHLSRFTMAE